MNEKITIRFNDKVPSVLVCYKNLIEIDCNADNFGVLEDIIDFITEYLYEKFGFIFKYGSDYTIENLNEITDKFSKQEAHKYMVVLMSIDGGIVEHIVNCNNEFSAKQIAMGIFGNMGVIDIVKM